MAVIETHDIDPSLGIDQNSPALDSNNAVPGQPVVDRPHPYYDRPGAQAVDLRLFRQEQVLSDLKAAAGYVAAGVATAATAALAGQ